MWVPWWAFWPASCTSATWHYKATKKRKPGPTIVVPNKPQKTPASYCTNPPSHSVFTLSFGPRFPNFNLLSLCPVRCSVPLPSAPLSCSSQLLGCSEEELAKTLCFRTVRAGGEVYSVPMSQEVVRIDRAVDEIAHILIEQLVK